VKPLLALVLISTACSPSQKDANTDSGDTDTENADSGDTSFDEPEFPEISGDCDVLDTELSDTDAHAFANVIDFGTGGFDAAYLSEDGTRILESENAGGSSIYSEVFAFEMLLHCEQAKLLKTETEISYTDPNGKITDILVDMDTLKIGVSVTRAFVYPPDTPYTEEMATELLTKKLSGIQASSANVTEEDVWEKQVLHVLAYTADHSAKVLSVFSTLEDTLKGDTVLLVTTTEGDDEFMY